MKEEEKIMGTGNVKISEDVVASIVTIAAIRWRAIRRNCRRSARYRWPV